MPLAAPVLLPIVEITDERLMELIQAHDPDALAKLYARHWRVLKGVSMKVLHNDADTDDLLQDVFVEIWERAGSYDVLLGVPLAWLSTLTRRRSIDRLRKQETYCRVEDRLAEETQTRSDAWTHVHEDVSQSERSMHLSRALATLPESQRDAINFAYSAEMTQREIAAHTGIALGTIKTRLELGLRKMAVFLFGFEDLLWSDSRGAFPRISFSGIRPGSEPAR